MKTHFTIVIPAYNVEKWARKNLTSALTQDYDNYDVYYVNDASTDNTKEIIEQTAKELSAETKANVKIIHNYKNRKALSNIITCVRMAPKNSVIITLDGDDRLPHKNVLSTLEKIYRSSDVWITAGSYLDTLTAEIGPVRVNHNEFWKGNIRHKHWIFSHLRTFRKELFMKVDEKDMTDEDGEIYKYTFDQVMMYPMAEMAGPEHFKAVYDILYIYNRVNPLSVDKIHREDQLRIEQVIRSKQPYPRLESLK